jgi:glyoxylase-like metal-dependent hydrolase (beta-lactamase superfamily II)
MMNELHTFTFNVFGEQTYLLEHGDGEATVFDPGMSTKDERQGFDELVQGRKLKIVNCLLTHAHLDHVMGTNWIAANYGAHPRLHPIDEPTWVQASKSAELYGIPMDPLPERGEDLGGQGSIIECGKFTLEVRLAPGHCLGHVVFVCHEHEFVIGGDVLFNGSIGRTDLPGGDAATLARSVADQLYTLPDTFEVFPGHGRPTTIGKEKATNPFVNSAGTGMIQGV